MSAAQVASLSPEAVTIEERSPFQIVMTRFRRHRLAMVSLVVMAVIFLITVLAPVLAPFSVQELAVNDYFVPWGTVDEATGRVHYMGTDQIGRDYFSRLIYAGRISLTVAITSTIISELVGIVIGAVSGFFGGWIDSVLMRFVEPLLNFMGNLLLLTPRDARNAVLIILILAGFGWLNAAQLMRGSVLSLREQTFVEASRSLGASNYRIIMRDMIPNAMAPIIVDASLGLAGYIVTEAALAFLGFGIQDPIPTWGNMLSASQEFMLDRPWLPLVPGLPIFLCSLAFNYIGDGLRDALDPRLKL
jgi:peptide/nickel transport system permease protein